MISVQDSQGPQFVDTNQNHGTKARIVLKNLLADGGHLCQEWNVDQVLTRAHALRNFGHREVTSRKFSPMCPWKCPYLPEIRFFDFYLIPFCVGGKFLPKSQMPNEEKSPPPRIVAGITQIRRADNLAQAFLVLTKLCGVKVAL